ncbi:hypothetical protein [Pseudoneobacillus sp. C159]
MFGKIIGACFIFLLLFISAWLVDHTHRGNNVIQPPVTADVIPINAITTPLQHQPIEVFMPREYVKIKNILQ